MAILSTENPRYTNLVLTEYHETTGYCRDTVTATQGSAADYVIGTVLGVITASGKYTRSVVGAVDGSATPVVVVIEDIAIPASTDTKVKVLNRGPVELKRAGLVFDASYDTAPELAVGIAALEAKGLKVLPSA